MLISVIIPVYNSEKFLVKSINSIVNQSYKNIQIILVDDGSTDSSAQICDDYAKKDQRVVAIHQQNMGVSRARNNGLLKSNGDYTIFVDADDWLDLDYIANAVKILRKRPTDLLFTPYFREYRKKSVENYIFGKNQIFYNKDDIRCKLLRKLIGPTNSELKNPAGIDDFSPIWGKFYKSNICKKITFLDIKSIGAEDTWFNIEYMGYIQNAIYFPDINYHYNKQNTGSLITAYNSENFNRKLKFYKHIQNYISNNSLGNMYRECLKNRIVVDLIGISNNIYNSKLSVFTKLKKEKEILNNSIYKEAFDNFNFKNLPLRWFVFFKLCKHKRYILLTGVCSVGEKLKEYLK